MYTADLVYKQAFNTSKSLTKYNSRQLNITWAVIYEKCDLEKQKYRRELTPNTQFQPCRVFVRSDLVERKIKRRRVSCKKIFEFQKKLGLDPYKINFDEEDIIYTLQHMFEDEILYFQRYVQNKRLDYYLLKYKLGVEIDEYGHVEKNFEDEQSKLLMKEEKLDCKIIRTGLNAPDINICRLINQICMHIKQLTMKLIKRSLIEDLQKELLEAAI